MTETAGTPVPGAARLAVVTGAAGFIGSRLCGLLVAAGWRVRAFVRYGSAGGIGGLAGLPEAAGDTLEVHRGDLLDVEGVLRAVDGADAVFHLGARISIPYSYEAPRDTFQVNALGTLNVLEAVRHAGARRLVHVSTSEVFGSAVALPMAEGHRLRAQSPYAASKIAADKLVESYACAFGLPAVVVRPFSTLPVLRVVLGSSRRTWTSSAATGQCSTPLGMMASSPSSNHRSRSRSLMSKRPLTTRKSSSSCSWWCQTNSPWSLTSLTWLSFSSPMMRGRQWSLNWANL